MSISIMDPHGDKQALKPARRTGCRTATACELESPPMAIAATAAPAAMGWVEPLFNEGGTEGVLLALAKVVEQRDHHTSGHSERLAFTGVALGVAMCLDSSSLLTLYLGGYLHDVGKVGMPDSVLFKPGRLSDGEWETMRTHPVRGEEICRPLSSMSAVLPLIRHHHERLDGSGYPDGLRGDAVPLLARVLQVVDIYDALTNPRPYKHAYTRPKALEILEEESECGWRDREITKVFVRMHKRMHLKIADYQQSTVDGGAPSMSESLANLQAFLAH